MDSVAGMEWEALERVRLSRDPRFDGKIFVAVRSTKIFCRPICPSPSSKPKNVRYYATASEATEAGFRPCLRCRPEAAPGSPAWLGTSAVVRRALRLIRDGALDNDSVEQLASRLGVGTRHLDRLFAQHVGTSPNAIAQTRRLQFAKRLLDETRLSITQIALAAGYGSLRRFNHCFRMTYRRSPRELRKRRPLPAGHSPEHVSLRFAYRPPYDWKHALQFLAARAIAGVEHVDGESYSRVVRIDDALATVRVSQIPDADCLELHVCGAEPGALFSIANTAKRMFDVAADPGRTLHLFGKDELLRPLARKWPGTRIVGAWDPFECAVRAIAGQQVRVAAGRTVISRIASAFGTRLPAVNGNLTHAFPTARQLARANLVTVGLTGARARAIVSLARAVRDGSIEWNAPTEEVVAALTAVSGIGPWTAQYVALRALGEPDAFPTGDLVLRQFAGGKEAPVPANSLEQRAQAWRPWRGYAVMLAWRTAGSFLTRNRSNRSRR